MTTNGLTATSAGQWIAGVGYEMPTLWSIGNVTETFRLLSMQTCGSEVYPKGYRYKFVQPEVSVNAETRLKVAHLG